MFKFISSVRGSSSHRYFNVGTFMKIINLITNNVFSLPKEDAEKLLFDFPNEFAKLGRNKKTTKSRVKKQEISSVLNEILDE